jgi:uncharacterized protein (TIGR02145 family)
MIFYNGHEYKTVEIFGQCWFKENLRTELYRFGTPIQLITNNNWGSTTLPAYCYYNNDTSIANTFGYLYNTPIVISDSVCPAGWHVSTDCDWMYLEGKLGISIADQQSNSGRGFNEALYLRDVGNTYWNNQYYPNLSNNSAGFSARAGGLRAVDESQGSFYSGVYDQAYFWTIGSKNRPIVRAIYSSNNAILRSEHFDQTWGMSIRCVKD